MSAPECCWWGCVELAEYVVGCATSERLNETWASCVDHVPKTIRFLKSRDAGWDIQGDIVAVAEISRAGG